MHSIAVAEWILALVTTPERAASTVGDLVEQGEDRGALWFWSGVLRTAASMMWCDVWENPGRMTGLAFRGLAVELGMSLIGSLLVGILFFVAGLLSGYAPQSTYVPQMDRQMIYLQAWGLATSLLIGRLLARWSPGRELAACFAYVMLIWILYITLSLIIRFPHMGSSTLLWTLVWAATIFAGAVWGRRRRMSAH